MPISESPHAYDSMVRALLADCHAKDWGLTDDALMLLSVQLGLRQIRWLSQPSREFIAADTRLSMSASPAALSPSGDFKVDPTPGFLLDHDYAVLYAAFLLAELTVDGPIGLRFFSSFLNLEAWTFCVRLRDLPASTRRCGTVEALFPAKKNDPLSSQVKYAEHVIDATVNLPRKLRGALAQWGIATVVTRRSVDLIALTPAGIELLRQLDGISVTAPHGAEHASAFLEHLRVNAPTACKRLRLAIQAGVERISPAKFESWWREHDPSCSTGTLKKTAENHFIRAREWGYLKERASPSARLEATKRGKDVLTD